MGSENPEDSSPVLLLVEEDPQEIGGLINSDGEEVDFSQLGKWIAFALMLNQWAHIISSEAV